MTLFYCVLICGVLMLAAQGWHLYTHTTFKFLDKHVEVDESGKKTTTTGGFVIHYKSE